MEFYKIDAIKENYPDTCRQLAVEERFLADVESGRIQLDPSEGIESLREIVQNLRNRKALLEKEANAAGLQLPVYHEGESS